jgi:hypothetical protein
MMCNTDTFLISQAASRASLDALVTAGRVCRAACLKGDAQVPGWSGSCAAAAEFDAAAQGPTAVDAAAAAEFDSAAAAVAAAEAFGAHFDNTAIPMTAAEPQQWGHAAASAEAASAATCCRLPSAPGHNDDDECMSPAKPAIVGDATGQAPLQQALSCYQSAPPPPLAALPQPDCHDWSVAVQYSTGYTMSPNVGDVLLCPDFAYPY